MRMYYGMCMCPCMVAFMGSSALYFLFQECARALWLSQVHMYLQRNTFHSIPLNLTMQALFATAMDDYKQGPGHSLFWMIDH